mmetsp:Transcript_20356/g.44082  ORF Transcript_20356/g.44082 Transcript_20356/m.44082 type:complete len:477 (-) Transcript_20356:57-1487(-)
MQTVKAAPPTLAQWSQTLLLVIEAALGLRFLHNHRIIHGDIKPQNILVTQYGHAKIADLGQFKTLPQGTASVFKGSSTAGTFGYIAPELYDTGIEDHPMFSTAVDVHAFGFTIWGMATGHEPWADLPQAAIMYRVLNSQLLGMDRLPTPPDSLIQGHAAPLLPLIEACASFDRKSRPTMNSLVSRLEKIQNCKGKLTSAPWNFPDELVWEEPPVMEGGISLKICNLDPMSATYRSIAKELEGIKIGSQFLQVVEITAWANTELEESFVSFLRTRQYQRSSSSVFNPELPADAGVKEALRRLQQLFVAPPDLNLANIVRVWHGCSEVTADAICKSGMADLRMNDGGWFGAGIYVTPQPAYAAQYSTGVHDGTFIPGEDKVYTVICCWAAVAMTYPITRNQDYDNPSDRKSLCKFHFSYPTGKRMDKALRPGCDSHFVNISDGDFQASADNNGPFDEIVLGDQRQVLPQYVVRFRLQD